MQSGSFIQILLVLAAIAARLNSISEEYQDIVKTLIHSLIDLRSSVSVSRRAPLG